MNNKSKVLILVPTRESRCSPENARPAGYSFLRKYILEDKLKCKVNVFYMVEGEFEEFYSKFLMLLLLQ